MCKYYDENSVLYINKRLSNVLIGAYKIYVIYNINLLTPRKL